MDETTLPVATRTRSKTREELVQEKLHIEGRIQRKRQEIEDIESLYKTDSNMGEGAKKHCEQQKADCTCDLFDLTAKCDEIIAEINKFDLFPGVTLEDVDETTDPEQLTRKITRQLSNRNSELAIENTQVKVLADHTVEKLYEMQTSFADFEKKIAKRLDDFVNQSMTNQPTRPRATFNTDVEMQEITPRVTRASAGYNQFQNGVSGVNQATRVQVDDVSPQSNSSSSASGGGPTNVHIPNAQHNSNVHSNLNSTVSTVNRNDHPFPHKTVLEMLPVFYDDDILFPCEFIRQLEDGFHQFGVPEHQRFASYMLCIKPRDP